MKLPFVSSAAFKKSTISGGFPVRKVAAILFVIGCILLTQLFFIKSERVVSTDDVKALSGNLSVLLEKQGVSFGSSISSLSLASDVPSQVSRLVPDAKSIIVWDRGSLDGQFLPGIKSIKSYSRMASAERLLALSDLPSGKAKTTLAKFVRLGPDQPAMVVVSAVKEDKVVQAVMPADTILNTFKDYEKKLGVPIFLVQDGRVVDQSLSSKGMDIAAPNMMPIGSGSLSVVYPVAEISFPWLGNFFVQALIGFGLVGISVAAFFMPRRYVLDVIPMTKPRAAPPLEDELPLAAPTLTSEPSSIASSEPQVVVSEIPLWFNDQSLEFNGKADVGFPDSAQTRGLMRSLIDVVRESFGGKDEDFSVLLVSDGREISSTLSKWCCEGFSSYGVSLTKASPLPSSLIPYLYDFTQSTPTSIAPLSLILWVGGTDEDPSSSGMKVFQNGKPWRPAEYSAWRLRLNARPSKSLPPKEGEVLTMDLTPFIPFLSRMLAVSSQIERPLRVVVDFGNGPMAWVAPESWESVGMEVIPLHADVDPAFPNRSSRSKSGWSSLSATVNQFHADFGVGVSLDGSSISVIDDLGQPVASSKVLAFLAIDALAQSPGQKIEFALSVPGALDDELATSIQHAGGIPSQQPSLNLEFPLAPSVLVAAFLDGGSAAFRFKDDRGIPDALFAVAKLTYLLSLEDGSMSSRMSKI